MAKASKILMQKLNISSGDVKLVSHGAFVLIVVSVKMQILYNNTHPDTTAV